MIKVISKNYSSGMFYGVRFFEGIHQKIHVGVALVDAQTAKQFEGLPGFECSPATPAELEMWGQTAIAQNPQPPSAVDISGFQNEIAALQAEVQNLKRQVGNLEAQKSELEHALQTELGKKKR